MTDLLKRVDTYLEMDFMDVSSYGNGTVSSGEVKIIKDLNASVEGRDVLVIEDIIDSGRTLSYLVDLIKYRKAKSVKLVTLLDKPAGRNVEIEADYVALSYQMNSSLDMVWIMQNVTAIYRILVF